MGRLVYHLNAALLGLGFLAAGCTAVFGINKDYREISGGTGGGGTGGGGVAPSTSSGSGPEDCFNNQDDDGNKQIDCADPACSGVAQCDAVPAGWTLIRATLVMSDPLPAPGTCADGTTMQKVYYTQPGGPPACSQCLCSVDPAATCTAPEISCYYYQSDCSGGANTLHQASSTQCINLSGLPGGGNSSGSCRITAPAKPSGMCTTSGGVPTQGPKWGGAVFVCDAASSPGGARAGRAAFRPAPRPTVRSASRRTAVISVQQGGRRQSRRSPMATIRGPAAGANARSVAPGEATCFTTITTARTLARPSPSA